MLQALYSFAEVRQSYAALFASFSASRLAFSHLACTALRALSLRSSAVIFAALAGPPFRPPRRPSMTAAGFFFDVLVSRAMPGLYVSGHEMSIQIFAPNIK